MSRAFLKKSKALYGRKPQESAYWFMKGFKAKIEGENKRTDLSKLPKEYQIKCNKIESDYPGYIPHLVGILQRYEFDVEYKKVSESWLEKVQDNDGPSLGLEANTGNADSQLIDADTEELQFKATCSITHKEEKSVNVGIYVQINDRKGILTHSTVLNEENCENVEVQFSSFEGDPFEVKILQDQDIVHDKDLEVVFVACDEKSLEENNIKPVTKLSQIKKKLNCYSYLYIDGQKSEAMYEAVPSEKEGRIELKSAVQNLGCPVFLAGELAGLVVAKQKAICIETIKDQIFFTKDVYKVDEKVFAKWTDGYFYIAKVVKKTEKGYEVHFYEYGDDKQDCSVSDIKRHQQSKLDELKTFLDDNKFESESLGNYNRVGILSLDEIKGWYLKKAVKEEFKNRSLPDDDGEKMDKILKTLFICVNNEVKKRKLDVMKNSPKLEGWEPDPSKGELDFGSQFTENGRISVRKACEKIANGFVPEGFDDENPIFYLKSTKENRYFKIEVRYNTKGEDTKGEDDK